MQTITLERLSGVLTEMSMQVYLEKVPVEPRVTIRKCRPLGRHNDYATGSLELDLALPEGRINLRIRWVAEGQSCVENGWIVREAPHLPGALIQGEILVLDDEGYALHPTCDELEALAADFYSYLPIDEWIEPALPARIAAGGKA